MQGLWLGIICALIVQATSLGLITARTNWEKEVSHSFYLFTFFFSSCYFVFNLSLIYLFFPILFLVQAKKATDRVYNSAPPVEIVS